MAQKIVTNSGKVLDPYTSAEKSSSAKSYESGSLQKIVTNSGKILNPYTVGTIDNALIQSVNAFYRDSKNFFNSAKKDTSEENKFNAADYFEERKKQAEALKKQSAYISKYLNDHIASYTQEAYDSLMEYLSTFDTQVDDALSLYQPSLDSKAGMAAYEDEFIAAMERNEQLRKNQQAATFGVDPMYQNLGVFDSIFRQSTDNSKQAVTDDWTAEQRYNLGHYQNTDPAMARQYAQLVNTGKDPFTVAAQQETEKASMLAMDLEAERRDIDQLKADLEDYTWNTDYDATSSSERKAFDAEIKRREKEISDREQKYNLAKRAQESEQFRSAADRSDFAAKSGYVDSGFTVPAFAEDADPDELVYEYINNQNGVRSKVDGENISLASKGYDLLSEDEVALYNYYYATEGPAKAQQYLNNIQDTLNYRMGERIAQSKSGDLWKQYLSAAVTGYSGAVSGLQNLFNGDEYIPTSAFQQASGMIREDLAEAGKLPEFYGDTSLGQIGYDLISTTANMAPSIAAGSLFGPIAGAATMGASAAGNAYQQALNNGYTKEQARTYAALTGASEAGLEYVLGGISKLGGEIPQRVLSNMVKGVDNAVAKAAITLGGSMASEGFEEGLQEVITPWIENLTLYADKNVNWDEVAYSTLLGALSGGFMEGPGVIANTAGVAKVDKQLQNLGAKGNTLELAELIVRHRSGEQLSQDEYVKLATSDQAMQVLTGVQAADSENEGESVEQGSPVATPRVSQDGRAIQISTNEAIEARDFASVNKGKATIQLKSGDTAEYSDVSFASEAEANQFYAAASLPGIDTENVNNLLHTIQEADAGKDVDSVVGIREAYGMGYFGMQESDLESGDAANLSPELRKAVFDIGRQQRASDAMVKAAAKPVTAKPSAGYKKVVFEGKTRQITKKQKAEIEFVDYIAENFSGNTVHVFESYKGRDGKYYYRDNNGKVHRAPNGKYVNGEIWLDLKAGDNQEGLMLNTFSHEMYHHIEKFDKAKAQELAEFVVKELGKKSVDDAVAEQIKKARKAGLGESYFERQGMTKEQARNEVYMRAMSDFVADSLETMFTRGDPAKAIANLKKENRTLFDEIKAFIDKWVSKVKEFYKDKTISKEGEMVAQLEKFEQLQQMFMEAVQSAGENYQAALVNADEKSTTKEGDAKFSNRRDNVQADITSKYQKTVDQILSLQNTKQDHILIGYTPKIYEELGMPSLPFVIGTGHIYSAAKTEAEAKLEGNYRKGVNYHGLGDSVVKNIYEKLNDPVMIIASKDVNKNATPLRSTHSVVAIVDVGNAQKSLLLPVEITAERTLDGVRMDVNALSSIYEKTVSNLVNEAIAVENTGDVGIFYAKKEALTLPGAGVQFPVLLQQSIASNSIVHRFSEKVNMNILDATQSQQFKRWFGDWQNDPQNASKVVNADGTPKVMYHGSPAQFSKFDRKKAKSSGLYGRGFYFTDSDTHAKTYGNTYSVYLNIRNPLQSAKAAASKDQVRGFLEAVAENEDYSIENYGTYDIDSILKTVMDGKSKVDAFKVIQDISATAIGDMVEATELFNSVNGTDFDGIIVPTETVAFRPEQIKSATDNVGTFDVKDSDIYHSLRNEKPATAREILSQIDISTRNKHESHFLGQYQENLAKLAELEPRLAELNAEIAELSKDKKKVKEVLKLQSERRTAQTDVNRLNRLVQAAERSDLLKRIVAEERLKMQKQQSRETMKSYKAEQRELIENMQMDQRVLRAQLNQTDSFVTVMGEELARLAKDYESKKIDLEARDSEYNRLLRIYEATKERLERNKESQEVQKQRKHVEEKAKTLMKMLAHPTKDAHVPFELQKPLQEFLDSIDFTSRRQARGGTATIKDIAYREALAEVRNAVASQVTAWEDAENGVFELDIPVDFKARIDAHIKAVKDAAKGLDTNTNRVYQMSSAELKDLSYILGVINKAVRDIDKMHMQGERARNSVLAKDTMQEMQRRKPIKGEQGSKFMWNNYIPFHAFRRYGKAGQKIFKGFTAGQAKLSRNVASVLEFSEKTYTAKEVREWEHTRHEIKLDSGKTVTMSPAQIMYFWCLSRRDQAIPHMQGGGMRLTTLEKFVDNAKVQGELVQKEHFTLTLGDVNRINNMLTDRQIEVAQKLQQFMQNVGGRWINEISMARWDFLAATEDNYVPIMTEDTGRDVKNPDQNKSSLFALLNKSFTNAPLKNAKNALVIDSLFNVFANHMSETAEYNAFALPLIDALKWFNYRERVDIGDGHINDIGVRRSIEDTLGTEARKYFTDFLTDINSSQKAGRHEDVFGKILGRSKAASVAWNIRVAIQQISALPRASMILNYRSLILGASHFRLKKATEEMKKYSGIALWKSMGYYDLNVARSVERQIKGDTNFLDKFNEWGMWLPGKMDERTWARIWLAAKSQVRNDTDLTGEELLQATAEKFEEVVYQTQVVDSVLTRSSYMRDKNLFIKEATSFMAEPTLSLNILMSAFQDYEEGHTTKEKVQRGLMIGFTGYALSAVANALLGSFSDAWRDDDEYETFWEKYGQALFGEKFTDGNLFSELNPLEKIMFVKDGLSVLRGNEPHSTYSKLLSGAVDLINAYQSAAEGKTSKTAYGVVYQTLQYLSTLSGVGISNMTREVVDVWNNTFGKWNPDKKLVRYQPNNGEELLNAIQKGTPEDIQRVFGRFESQKKAESALQHAIREKYVAGEMTEEEAQDLLTTNFDRDDEHEVYWILDSWDYARENGSSEGYLKYGKFFEAVDSGEDYTSEMDRLMTHGAEASDIRSQISRHYRKQYLEDETAREEIREKLRPVYEATGMYSDDIDAKFNDWDFEAEYGMTYGEYKAEYREGNVTENELRGAMKFYGLMQYEIAADIRSLNNEIKFVDKYDMTLSEMKDAYDNGDISPNQMTSALVFDGMTQKDAKAWIKQRNIENRLGIDYMEWDDAYKYGDISRQTFYNAMIENGTPQKDADDAILSYDWLKNHVKQYPDLASADGKKFAVRIHAEYAPDETLEDYGVSIDAYLEYKKLRPECKGVDANGDGKTDDGTLRDSVLRMIDSLPISNEAKDGLALMNYSKRSIRRNAPWH